MSSPPRVFIGATANPCMPPVGFQVERLAKKVSAGAQFVQTQYWFDVEMLRDYRRRVRERELHPQSSQSWVGAIS